MDLGILFWWIWWAKWLWLLALWQLIVDENAVQNLSHSFCCQRTAAAKQADNCFVKKLTCQKRYNQCQLALDLEAGCLQQFVNDDVGKSEGKVCVVDGMFP